VAGILAALALADSAVHLGPQHFPVSDRTLGLARRFLVQPKERADFGWLAAQPIWSGVKLRVLLDHVELAVYNRELINWTLDETMYRDFVLWPVTSEKQKFGKSYQQKAEMAEGGGQGAKAEIGLPAGQAGKSGKRKRHVAQPYVPTFRLAFYISLPRSTVRLRICFRFPCLSGRQAAFRFSAYDHRPLPLARHPRWWRHRPALVLRTLRRLPDRRRH
jgi:hypothetical protein